MTRKDSIENMKKLAKERGGKCVSTEYTNAQTPLSWECKEGHTWKATPSMVKGSKNKPGTWCKICGLRMAAQKRMHTIETMQKLAEKKGGIFASPEYLGSQEKHTWKCDQYPVHPEFQMIPNSVQQGQWCPKCSGNTKPTLIELNELARIRHPSARCASQEYLNGAEPLEWECGVSGHPSFFSPYRNVKHEGAWCKLCKKEIPKNKKYSHELCNAFALEVGGKFLSKERYRNTKQVLQWECRDGHKFSRSLGSIISYRSFCPACVKRVGLREEYIRELFFHLFGAIFERTRNLQWLRNKEGNAMELDGYNADLSIAFEHNGKQHYEIDGFFTKHGEKLKRMQEGDALKAQLCRENNVSLIVIPYQISIDAIQIHVINELKKFNKESPNRSKFEHGFIAPSMLKKLRAYATSQGGHLLSQDYLGSSMKLEWKCKEPRHPKFAAAPSALISRKSWCRRCANDEASESYRISAEQVQKWAEDCNGELIPDKSSMATLIDKKSNQKNMQLQLFQPQNNNTTYAISDKAMFRCLKCYDQPIRTIRQVKDGRLCFCSTNKKRNLSPSSNSKALQT